MLNKAFLTSSGVKGASRSLFIPSVTFLCVSFRTDISGS
uniref:Uncharacterized protein n=1 Tax=Arundo donax TaxID=35708 RepID=A0A0A9CB52_ARUDO